MSIIHQAPNIFVDDLGGADPSGNNLVWPIDASSRLYHTVTGTPPFSVEAEIARFVRGKVGQMIAFHVGGSGALEHNYTSPDGVVWTDRSADLASPWNLSPGFTCQTLFYLRVAGLWFAKSVVGRDYFTSSDGITWVERTFPGSGSHTLNEDAYMTDGVHDFVLDDDVLWATQDGISWASRGTQSSCQHVVYTPDISPRYWCLGGVNATNVRVRSSATGAVGTFSDNTASETSLEATAINWNQVNSLAHSVSIGKTVFGRQVTGTGTAAALTAYTDDMVNWTETPAMARGFGMRYSATLGIFVNMSFNFATAFIGKSSDGINWTQTQYEVFPQNVNHFSADLLSSYGSP